MKWYIPTVNDMISYTHNLKSHLFVLTSILILIFYWYIVSHKNISLKN